MERDFPLLAAMLGSAPMRSVLLQDAVLKAETAKRWDEVAEVNRTCQKDAVCRSKALRFTPEQVDEVSAELRSLYEANAAVKAFVREKLQPAAVFSLDPSQPDEARLVDSWVATAKGLNLMIGTYCDGVPPRYAAIDSMTLQAGSPGLASLTGLILDGLDYEETASGASRSKEQTLFFEPTMRFAIRIMEANERDEAGRLWPIEKTENAAAVKAVRSVKWAKYPHSVIVVLGAGGETPNVPLSPRGKERVRGAVEAYRKGSAPFVLVSGGYVHPLQTPFSEALEMKRYLMEVYGLPASAILVDPYARHTTTNLRNAVREIYAYHIPVKKPILIVSDEAHINSVASEAFATRNEKELGYQPVVIGARVTPSSIEGIPSERSLYRDTTDPLDP
ncbi:protein of unknown function DUF218 [Granulicella sibirica]|uniref:DUF218 domain-containing protein n=1 Tax=Granulicella sibirica TaxID=2479048 RepID=A0A4Q0T6N5_9BACT|nr:protein of unknown function DUF218 [Granulicella sibirica]